MMKPLIQKMLKPCIVLTFCALALTAKAQDTLFVHMQGADTLFTELQKGPKPVYVKNKPVHGPALRTNLLWWGVGAPNLGAEFPIGEHWSLGLDAGFKSWDRFFSNDPSTSPKRWRHLAIVPDVRWYPREVGSGFFLDANLLYLHYNVGNIKMPFGMYKSLRTNYRQGDLFGGGLAAGYAWNLGPRWRIEAEAGVAVGPYSHDNYYIDQKCRNCIIDSEKGFGVVPKLGVTVVYTFGKRKQKELVEQVIQHPVDTVKPVIFEPELKLVEERDDMDEAARQINAAIAALSAGRPAEALRLAETVKDDPRAQEAYAVALWETGRRQEALAVLRTAAASGAPASRNLEQMENVLKIENQK